MPGGEKKDMLNVTDCPGQAEVVVEVISINPLEGQAWASAWFIIPVMPKKARRSKVAFLIFINVSLKDLGRTFY